jgi:phosphatidylglycerol:prolipoprotein diacylglycerol transferase
MSLLAAWTHDLDPCAVHAFGRCLVRWYGLSYVASFVAAWLILRELIRRGRTRMSDPGRAADLVFAGAVGAIAGGRIGYVLLYDPQLLWTFGSAPPWWGLLMINRGGMASHGGIVGVIVAAWWFARREKIGFFHATDLVALAAPAGLFFGRLANFINGELLGRVVAPPGEPAPSWAVRYPQELLTGHAPELTLGQQAELARLASDVAPGADTAYAKLVAVVDAVQSGAPGVAERLAPLLAARHPSQLYQAAAEGLVLGAVLWIAMARTRLVGVVGALFVLVYGALRVATEHWRLPDDHLAAPEPLGLSRGQWYSLAMIVAGVLLLWRAIKRGERMEAPASEASDQAAPAS